MYADSQAQGQELKAKSTDWAPCSAVTCCSRFLPLLLPCLASISTLCHKALFSFFFVFQYLMIYATPYTVFMLAYRIKH